MKSSIARQALAWLVLLLVALALSGCSGSNNMTSKNPGGGGSSAPPPPGGSGGGGGTSPGPWKETLVSNLGNDLSSTVTVTTSGDVQLHVVSGKASTQYTVTFFPVSTNGSSFDIGTLMTDASGNADATIHFPKSGDWSGGFQLETAPGTNPDFSTNSASLGSVSVPLLPVTKLNQPDGLGTCSGCTQDAGSGSVTANAQQITVTLSGGAASTMYAVTQCAVFGTSSCFQIGTFTTDASGNGTLSVNADSQGVPPAGNWLVVQNNNAGTDAGLASGFVVP